MNARKITMLLFAGLLTSACNLSDDGNGAPGAGSLEADFVVKDKFDQEVSVFTAGEDITFDYTVTNISGSTVTYEYTSPGHDIRVLDGDTTVWSKFHGRSFPQVTTSGQLSPGEVLDLGATWNGTDNEGERLPPGKYKVVPALTLFVNGERIHEAESVDITLN